jgi:hypothetical protein
MVSYFWGQYNRIEYQQGQKASDLKLVSELGILKGMFAGLEIRLDNLSNKARPDQKAEIAEISALARTANNKIDEANVIIRRTPPEVWARWWGEEDRRGLSARLRTRFPKRLRKNSVSLWLRAVR